MKSSHALYVICWLEILKPITSSLELKAEFYIIPRSIDLIKIQERIIEYTTIKARQELEQGYELINVKGL